MGKKISEEIDNLKNGLEKCEKEKQEYLAGWQRTQADFLNYKKDEIQRIKEILNYGRQEWILNILPILDNFYLVEKNLSEDLKDNEYIKGIFQIKKQFEEFLKNQGIEEIKIKIGDNFDPNLHEIVEQIDTKEKKDKIIEIIEKGYKMQDKVIKPVKVKVEK